MIMLKINRTGNWIRRKGAYNLFESGGTSEMREMMWRTSLYSLSGTRQSSVLNPICLTYRRVPLHTSMICFKFLSNITTQFVFSFRWWGDSENDLKAFIISVGRRKLSSSLTTWSRLLQIVLIPENLLRTCWLNRAMFLFRVQRIALKV